METVYYDIRCVDRTTGFSDYYNFVAEYKVIEKGNIFFLKIVRHPNDSKIIEIFIALDTIKELIIKEMEEIK